MAASRAAAVTPEARIVAIERGEVRADASVEASFHVLNGAVFSRIVLGGEAADDRLVDDVAEPVLSGLEAGD